MTGIMNLETSRLWDILGSRSKAAMAYRLCLLGDAASAIEAVMIDPFAPHRAVVREMLSPAVRVTDGLHPHLRDATTAVTTQAVSRRSVNQFP